MNLYHFSFVKRSASCVVIVGYVCLLLMDFTIARTDCCSGKYSGIPGGCDGGVEYNNTMYYCVQQEDEYCVDCHLDANYSSVDCQTCCAPSRDDCSAGTGIIYGSSYSKFSSNVYLT